MNARTSSVITARRQSVDRTLEGLKLLPSSALVAMKVLELKRRDDSGAGELARVISADAALASKILAVANSAAFAPVSPVRRLSVAIAQIGLNNLLPLVFGLSIAGIFNKLSLPAEDQTQLWRASLLKAVTARACVRRLASTLPAGAEREAAAEEAFLSALFQDIALPVFSTADRSAWPELMVALDATDEDRPEREANLFGIDHTAVAATIARTLGLPAQLAAIAGAHHTGISGLTAAGAGPMAVGIDAAASLPHRIQSFSPKVLNALMVRLKFTVKVSAEELNDLAREIVDDFNKTTALFGKPEDATASYKQFLQNLGAEVAECLQSAIISSATEIGGLKEHQRRLSDVVATLEDKTQRAEFDQLTQVLTRTAFLARLEKLLPMTRRHSASCAVGFIDLNDFKGINDTHGHDAGDAALVATGTQLNAVMKEIGIAGRMGGDEFVFALVARPEALDAAISTVVNQIKRVCFTHGQMPLEVTASVGVVPMRVLDASVDAQHALREADDLMYQAKRVSKGRSAVGHPPTATGPAVNTSSTAA